MGLDVIAEQMNLGKADARYFCIYYSTLETASGHPSNWSVLEIPDMNEWSGSFPSRLSSQFPMQLFSQMGIAHPPLSQPLLFSSTRKDISMAYSSRSLG